MTDAMGRVWYADAILQNMPNEDTGRMEMTTMISFTLVPVETAATSPEAREAHVTLLVGAIVFGDRGAKDYDGDVAQDFSNVEKFVEGMRGKWSNRFKAAMMEAKVSRRT